MIQLPFIFNRVFRYTNRKRLNIGKVLLVESSKDSMEKISNELTTNRLVTWRIGNTSSIVHYHKKYRFDLILVHFNHAYDLRSILKTGCMSLPICLVFDDTLKDQPHVIVDTLLASGCKNYLLNPLTLNMVLPLIGKDIS